MYRTGKSYLLNRMLLDRAHGFSVGPSINPCTKGLWMWSQPLKSLSEEGMPIMVVDTEGFGAFDEDQNHDIRIFTLSILISSFFIYNSVGSIDENSIQSLSFVINLSKHIQMKMSENKFKNDKAETEDLSSIFPNFLWVLRDFSLQLINDDGEVITPKEYLENVLEERTKGAPSDDNKNKIRKLIKSYFKDRDCHTLVRPLTGEAMLQNLENIPFEDLRPEFVDSVFKLRRKVLTRVKPKSLKGKNLNGEMFVEIIKAFINSINAGAIPNIENTWNMMCKIESTKALEFSERIYEEFIKEKFNTEMMNDILLANFHKEAKRRSIESFKKKSVGDISLEFERILKNKIKEKFNFYKTINEEETKNNITKILQKQFSNLEYKIHTNEIKTLTEIETEFRGVEKKIDENYQNFSFKDAMINNFKYKVFGFCLEFFQNRFQNEIHLLQSKLKELTEKYNNDLQEITSSNEREINKKSQVIETQKSDIFNLKNQLSLIREENAMLKQEKDQQSKQLNDKMMLLKEESNAEIKELSDKLAYSEEKKREAEKKAISLQGEFEKQKALLDQRLEYCNKQIEDFNKREKESVIELRSQIKEQQIAIKDSNNKHDSIVKSLNKQIEALNEKLADYETLLSSKDALLEMEKSKLEESMVKHNIEVEDLKEKVSSLKTKLESERNRFNEENKSKENEFTGRNLIALSKIEELEIKLRTSDDTFKSLVLKVERENALLKQNNEFLDLQLKEQTNLMEEQKRSYESILSKLEMKGLNDETQEYSKKIEELKSFFAAEKKQLEDNFEKSRQIYINQIDGITEKYNEIECKMKIEKEEFQKEINDYKIRLDKLKRDYDNAVKENQNLSENSQIANDEIQRRLRKLTSDYEKKLEEKEQKHQRDQMELNRNSEETIAQLRGLFDQEKLLFDEKMKDEKIRTEKKIKALTEEYEAKLTQQETELREEIESLNEELQLEISNLNNFLSQAQQENGLLVQRNDTLEQLLNEAKEALNRHQLNARQILEKELENYKKDRTDFLVKIEALNNENSQKEKELTSVKMKKDQLEFIILEKENYLSMVRKELEDDKKELQNKNETLKSKLQSTNDDFMMKKLEFTRETALLKQQIEFQDKKIEELQRIIEENQKKYEEKLYSLRTEVERDLNEKYERIRRDREEFEAKYLAKKKEMRDLEQNYIRQSSLVEKDKAILNEKILALESKKKELIDNYEKELETITTSFKSLKDEKLRENEIYQGEIESLRKKNFAFEQVINELKSSNEKDKLLWEGRFKFLETQREQSKKELIDTQKKFEIILENVQKKFQAEKEKLEGQNQNSLINLEVKYTTEIKEMKENHSKLYSDLLDLNKDLERELKAIKLQQELRGKSLDPSAISKRISELLEVQDRMKRDLDECRREKEAKISEIQSMCEREKDILKVKINDIESRLKDVESKRGQLMLEYEREKAKSSLEKDHMDSKVKELQETIDRLTKKIESLLRENEKFKNGGGSNLVSSSSTMSKRNCSSNNLKTPTSNNYVNNSTLLPNYSNILNSSTINPIVEKDLNNYNQPKIYNPYLQGNNMSYVKPIIQSTLDKSLNYNDLNPNPDGAGKISSSIYYHNKANSHKFSIRQTKSNQSNNGKDSEN